MSVFTQPQSRQPCMLFGCDFSDRIRRAAESCDRLQGVVLSSWDTNENWAQVAYGLSDRRHCNVDWIVIKDR